MERVTSQATYAALVSALAVLLSPGLGAYSVWVALARLCARAAHARRRQRAARSRAVAARSAGATAQKATRAR
eukprot:7320352-Prymnesium_polylepis.2